LTLSRSVPGPDSKFSLEPCEFRLMVDAIRTAEQAVGSVHYGVSEQESKSRFFRRSLYVVKSIKAGERLTQENIRSIRPGDGLAPKHLNTVLGRAAACDIAGGTPLSWSQIL